MSVNGYALRLVCVLACAAGLIGCESKSGDDSAGSGEEKAAETKPDEGVPLGGVSEVDWRDTETWQKALGTAPSMPPELEGLAWDDVAAWEKRFGGKNELESEIVPGLMFKYDSRGSRTVESFRVSGPGMSMALEGAWGEPLPIDKIGDKWRNEDAQLLGSSSGGSLTIRPFIVMDELVGDDPSGLAFMRGKPLLGTTVEEASQHYPLDEVDTSNPRFPLPVLDELGRDLAVYLDLDGKGQVKGVKVNVQGSVDGAAEVFDEALSATFGEPDEEGVWVLEDSQQLIYVDTFNAGQQAQIVVERHTP